MHKISKFLRIVTRIFSLIWLVFIVFHFLLTGKVYLWNLFGNIPTFFFVIIPVVFLILEGFRRKRKVFHIVVAVFALILGATQFDVNLVQLKNTVPSEHCSKIKVFSWNTYCWDFHKDKEHFYQVLKKENADIYLLQEYLYFLPNWRTEQDIKVDPSKIFKICTSVPGFASEYMAIDDLQRLKREFLGYNIAIHHQFVTLSRYPIRHSHMDSSEQYSVNDIDINGRLVRFFNVHMLLHIEPVNIFTPYFYRALQRRFVARRIGFNNLNDDLKDNNYDYVIAGDFNSTKALGVLNGLLKDHIDAVKYSNELIPLNFEWFGVRFWRFDYFLVHKSNQNIKIGSFKSIEHEGLSEHNPEVAVLYIKDLLPLE